MINQESRNINSQNKCHVNEGRTQLDLITSFNKHKLVCLTENFHFITFFLIWTINIDSLKIAENILIIIFLK